MIIKTLLLLLISTLSITANNSSIDQYSKTFNKEENQTTVNILYATDRKMNPKKSDWKDYYTAARGELTYGVSEVSIPKTHKYGGMERPEWFPWAKEQAGKHIIIDKLETFDEKKFILFIKDDTDKTGAKIDQKKSDLLYYHTVEKEFLSFLKTRLYNLEKKDILIFIHGYNVTFAETIRRTAQLSYDLSFKGVSIAYSWPSRGETNKYISDESSVKYTVPHLVAFLNSVINNKENANIYVIVHGMGIRALANALKEISLIYTEKPVFKNIILATPDIDRNVFQISLLPYIRKTANKITLYSGSDDSTLKLPKVFHDNKILGEGGDNIFVAEGLNTIDAIGINTDSSLLGHSYFDRPEDQKILMAKKVFLQLNTGGHTGTIRDIIVTSSGNIISASDDKTIRIWNSKTGREKRKILGKIGTGTEGAIYAIALSPDGEYLATGGYLGNSRIARGGIRIYHYPTGILIKVLKSHTNDILDLAFSSDGNYLISGSSDTTAKIWDVPQNFSLQNTIKLHTDSVYGVKIIKKDEGYYAVTASLDKKVALFDMQKKEITNSHQLNCRLKYLTVSPKHIAVYGNGKEISIYDYSLKPIKTIYTKTRPTGLAYSKDGSLLMCATETTLGDIKIYNAKNHYQILKSFKKHFNTIKAVAFINNREAIFVGGDKNEIYVWNVESGSSIRKIAGLGRSVWNVGLKGDRISWKNKRTSDFTQRKLQKSINLRTMKIKNNNLEAKNFNSIPTKYKNYSLSVANGKDGNPDAILVVKINGKIAAKIARSSTDGYRHNCYGFYKDTIISGSNDGHLEIYNLEGKEIANLTGHTGEVQSIALDKDRLVSGSNDQTIRVWDLSQINIQSGEWKSIEPQLNLFISKRNDYIAWTNKGYFTASEEGMKYLYFHLNQGSKMAAKAIPIEKLYDHFFRPDLIQLKLSGNEEAYKKAIQGLDFKSALKNPPPIAKFNQTPKKTDKNKIRLSFNIQDEGGGIGLIRVYQEGKLIQTIGEGKINKQAANINTLLKQEILDKTIKIRQKTYIASLSKSIDGNLTMTENIAPVQPDSTTNEAGTYTINLDLISGNNEISIEAFNKTNTVVSYRESIIIDANIPKQKPKLYAIVGGVNKFEAPSVHSLKYSENDAEDIKEILENKIISLFESVKVTYLKGQDLTKENILKTVQKIAQIAKLEDTIIFYISTHGRAAGGKLYLVPYNNKNIKNWIDFEQIFKSIQSIKALNQIFVLDTCESGKANDIVSSVYDSRASVLARSSGVHMLLATTKGTFAFEHTDPTIYNGVFTYKILQAMRNKTTDINKDKTITILELSKKLQDPTSASDYQYPVIRNVGSDMGLVKIK